MIRLFVSDIDGCLAEPYRPFDLELLGIMAAWTREAGEPGNHPILPAVGICSGRAYPYVEAMSQLLGCQVPVLFESGAGRFNPLTAASDWHPAVTADIREDIRNIQHFMATEVVVSGPGMSMDFAKSAQAALVGTDPDALATALDRISTWVQANTPGFSTFHTHISIDVVPDGLTKREGLAWLADDLGLRMDELAFIGDTNGDIGALKSVGYSFAPANAQPEVKAVVDHVCEGNDIEGVLEAYRLCTDRNAT